MKAVIALCALEEPATLTTGEIARQMGVTQGALFSCRERITGLLEQAPRVFAIYRHGIAADGEARA